MRRDKWSGNYSLRVCLVGFLLVLFSVSTNAAQEHKSETRPAASLWYQELAAQGDVDAKYNLGMMNEVGWSIPVDLTKAIRWYREAAKEGHAEAQLRLGMLYYLGLGTKKSKLKGESWIRKAAKQEHDFAKSLNEMLFEEDVPDTLNQKSVLKEVRSVYLQDEAKAISSLLRLVDRAKQKSSAQQQAKEKSTIRERREVRVAVVATKRGEARVVNKTGESKSGESKKPPQVKKKDFERIESVVPEFIEKKSVKENRTLAQSNLATIRLQANKGLASAQYNLGRMYELGVKVPVDDSKALALYKKSADQGYASAQYRLAISMLYGKTTERDEKMGRKWLSAAAGNGHRIAKNLLANLTDQEGVFGGGNSIAVSWYLERAVAGNAEAALSLGKIFEYGWGAGPDLREAVRWYEHARMLGSKDAEELLLDMKARVAQITDNTVESGEDAAESFRPPDWVAYLVAITLAIGIIFWPLFKRKITERRLEVDADKFIE
ncbi:MAG: sel1 repeat family protein [Gammaproteobacteria bacterium]|nr:sel1 repeat family protein [Gammaproteobacteria bacterium]